MPTNGLISDLSNQHHMSGGQNYLLLAMDMAKVAGPLFSLLLILSVTHMNFY